MSEILSVLTNKNYEIVKMFLNILASFLYHPIYRLGTYVTNEVFGGNHVLYISRISYFVILFAGTIAAQLKFTHFCKKNMESLILLGNDYIRCMKLFVFLNYEVLFLQIYFGCMFFQRHGVRIETAMIVNIINAIFSYTLGILFALKSDSNLLRVGIFFIVGMLGVLLGTGKISYDIAYQVVMSETVKQILFSENIIHFISKFIITMLFVIVTIVLLKNKDIESGAGSAGYHGNWFGDIIHKWKQKSINSTYSLGMYKNMDYVIWKIFSTVFFAFICIEIHHNVLTMISAYTICLIAAFYFRDIYDVERKLQIFYFMSDYSYKKYLWSLTITGICILGDNVLLILMIYSVVHAGGLLLLFATFAGLFLISAFLNLNLFLKYPEKQSYSSIFVILLKLHMPVFNIVLACKSMRQGNDNWEKMTYEYK